MADIVFEDGDQLLALVVDATVEEIHRASAQATEQPVERGVDVTDHVRPERRALTLNVVISDTPIRATDALGGEVERVELELPARRVHAEHARRTGPTSFEGAERSRSAPRPTTYVEVFRPSEEEPTRVADSWALLLDARDRALLAVVTTGLETYEDMVLIEAHTTRSAQGRLVASRGASLRAGPAGLDRAGRRSDARPARATGDSRSAARRGPTRRHRSFSRWGSARSTGRSAHSSGARDGGRRAHDRARPGRAQLPPAHRARRRRVRPGAALVRAGGALVPRPARRPRPPARAPR